MKIIDTNELETNEFRLEHDVHYGIDRRSGYSVSVNGHCLAALEPLLIVALWKAWRRWKAICLDTKGF